MFRGNARWLGAVAPCIAAIAVVGCGSRDSGGSSSASSSGGGTKSSSAGKAKIAIVATRPEDSAFVKPAIDAAADIKSKLGNQVTIQGGVQQANVAKTLEGYASRGYGLV